MRFTISRITTHLPGLDNRVLLQQHLTQALTQVREGGDTLAVLFIDLDNFKNINDTLGHSIGDALLKRIALRLEKSLRQKDKVARLGGDEFAVVNIGDDQPRGAATLASRLTEITQEINSAVEEQASGAQAVVRAMDKMRELVQQSASSSTELSAAAEQMLKLSRNLLDGMDRFVLDRANQQRPRRGESYGGKRRAAESDRSQESEYTELVRS